MLRVLRGLSLLASASTDGQKKADDHVSTQSATPCHLSHLPGLPSLLFLGSVALSFRLDVTMAVLKQSDFDKLQEALTMSLLSLRTCKR